MPNSLEISSKKTKSKNSHDGHRSRMKERVAKDGLESLHEHEVLEYILFFSIPQGDTNALAHELLDKFGSLANVLEASAYELEQMSGVGKHTIALLTVLPEICKRYELSKWHAKPIFNTTAEYSKYGCTLCIGKKNEALYMICLDSQRHMINAEFLYEGTIDSVFVYTRKVIEVAIANRAKYVILVHNHPSGVLKPSLADRNVTLTLGNNLASVDVILVDHIIVAGDRYFSFMEKGLLNR